MIHTPQLDTALDYPINTPADEPVTLLIEGILSGRHLTVCMPNGDRWLYDLPICTRPSARTLICSIDTSTPAKARCYIFSPEGIYPYLGEASRYGVDVISSNHNTVRGAA